MNAGKLEFSLLRVGISEGSDSKREEERRSEKFSSQKSRCSLLRKPGGESRSAVESAVLAEEKETREGGLLKVDASCARRIAWGARSQGSKTATVR